MALEPGSTQPLTQSEVKAAFADAPRHNEHFAEWNDIDGRPHRDGDLPARVWSDGAQVWWQHGDLHRTDDLPAIVTNDGTLKWYNYDKRHRGNHLPAIIHTDGRMEWYEHDEQTGDQDDPPPDAVFPGQQTKSARKK